MKRFLKALKSFLLAKVRKIQLVLAGNKLGRGTYISYNTEAEENINIEENTRIVDCSIGKGTDIASNCEFVKCKIGRYCVIGDDCKNIYGHHPTFVMWQ